MGKVYVYEPVGTLIGGVLSTYLFVLYLNTFQIVSLIVLLNMAACIAVLAPHWKIGPVPKGTFVLLSALALFAGFLLLGGGAEALHRYSVRAQWKNLNVVHYENSQYGNACVVENEDQYIYFIDGIPAIITPIPDIPSVEETLLDTDTYYIEC